MILGYNFAYGEEMRPATYTELLNFRIAAIAMSLIVIVICLICIIIIKRNITVGFSLKVIGLVIVINLGFLFN